MRVDEPGQQGSLGQPFCGFETQPTNLYDPPIVVDGNLDVGLETLSRPCPIALEYVVRIHRSINPSGGSIVE